jgi:hypothetical protein
MSGEFAYIPEACPGLLLAGQRHQNWPGTMVLGFVANSRCCKDSCGPAQHLLQGVMDAILQVVLSEPLWDAKHHDIIASGLLQKPLVDVIDLGLEGQHYIS